MAISPELVERAIAEISKRRANYEYFFERLSSPEWIAPLRRRGFFDDPPSLEIDERGVRAPSWPPSQFLARVAARAPEQVLEVILAVDTLNERVHADFAEAAASMPAPLARRWVEQELEWLRAREHLYFVLPRKLVEVIGKLASQGEVDTAFAVAEELFRPVPGESQAVGQDLKRAAPRFSHWEYDQLLDRAVQLLLAAAPESTVQFLVRLLERAIDLASFDDTDPGEDYSHVWRPRLVDDERDDRDIQQSLVSALRDTAATVRQQASVPDPRLLELLEEGRSRVFKRIAAFALARPPLADPPVAARVLVDRDSFFDPEPSAEYRELLEITFGRLDRASQYELLGWIAEGPDLNEYRDRRRRTDGETASDTDVEHHAARWRIRRLRLIQDHLQENWRQRYEDLVERFGEWRFITSFEISTWMGPQSPVDLEELRSRSDEDLLSLLEGYKESSRWFGPSPEGLARTLSALAEDDSERISRLAPRLASLRPVHVQWALIGLGKAVRDGKPVAWPPLVELLNGVVHVRQEDEQAEEDEDNHGRWGWVRQEVAGVLDAGFQSTAYPIPFDLRRSTWRVLEALTDDSEPTPEYEERYGGSNMDPATLALNTIRGRAMHAVVTYALWVRRAIESERGESAVRVGFDAMPEVRQVLDRHLDPRRDPSVAVRAVYGQRLPWLVLVDEAWTAGASRLVFPEDPNLRNLRDAAWHSYIIFCRPYDNVFRILRSQYSNAVERLHDDRPPWRWIGGSETPEHRLAAHLLTFYWRGTLGFNESDDLLERFYAKAMPDSRAFAVEFLGRALRQTERLENRTREGLERFWEWRIEEAERGRRLDPQKELAAFAWWADADVLSPEWRLTQLEHVFRLGGSLAPESVAFDALEKLARLHPVRSGRLLRVFLEREKEGWTIDSGQRQIERILRICLESGDPEALRVAEQVAHWLGSRGYQNFRVLLRGDRS